MRTIFCDSNTKLQKITHLNFAVYYETFWADFKTLWHMTSSGEMQQKIIFKFKKVCLSSP